MAAILAVFYCIIPLLNELNDEPYQSLSSILEYIEKFLRLNWLLQYPLVRDLNS